MGCEHGYDGAKKLVERKRHILVDTEGLLIALNVHPANSMDHDGLTLLLTERVRAPHGSMLYNKGTGWIERVTIWTVQIAKALHRYKCYRVPNNIPPDQIGWSQYVPSPGFHVLPRRWVVGSTFAWLSHNHWLSKDYERLRATSDAWISITMIWLMVKRLARP